MSDERCGDVSEAIDDMQDMEWELDLHGGDYDQEGPGWVVIRPRE